MIRIYILLLPFITAKQLATLWVASPPRSLQ